MASSKSRVVELNSWHSDWTDLRVIVLGLGKTGFSVADTLAELGAKILVLTEKADQDLLDIIDVLGIEYLVSEDQSALAQRADSFNADLAIVSPGIRPDNNLVMQLSARDIRTWTDIDLAWRLKDRFIKNQEWICITGTNGKTTTTEIIEAMLRAASVRAVACGNIGTPILDCIRDPAEFEVLVVELSSFQLHYLDSIAPYSSAVLNVADDHLDWHGGFEAYSKAKGRIYENTKVACIYNLADSTTEKLVESAEVQEGARAIGFGLGIPQRSNIGYVEDILVDRAFLEQRDSSALEIAGFEDLKAFGVLTPHLLSNIAAATAAARSFGVPPAACRKALREFTISPHRIELIVESKGVRYVNDSKATNAHAADASLSSFESVVWIVGGLLKGVDISELVSKHARRLRGAAVIGKDRGVIVAAFNRYAPEVKITEIEDSETVMRSAVSWAREIAKSGDVVLLAPAAASMDQFRDYQDRGDQFRSAVFESLGNSDD